MASVVSLRHISIDPVNDLSSPSLQFTCGVPQGSVLGPVLFILYTTALLDIIVNHSGNHQLFADDINLQKSALLSGMNNLTQELTTYTDDLKTWMTENQLKLRNGKAEVFLFSFSSPLKSAAISLPDSITLGSHKIAFSDSPRNLGFTLDSKLSMKRYVKNICHSAYGVRKIPVMILSRALSSEQKYPVVVHL